MELGWLAFAFKLLAIFHAGWSCSVPRNWRTRGVGWRAVRADIVILGKVVHSPYEAPATRNPYATAPLQQGEYDAQFRIICALKGSLRAQYVNISGFGSVPGHCVDSRALGGETYVTFIRKRRGRYFVAEINSQDGTIPFKKSILRKVVRQLRRKGDLNKSRNGCVGQLRARRKSGKKSKKPSKGATTYGESFYERKPELTGESTSGDRVSRMSARNGRKIKD